MERLKRLLHRDRMTGQAARFVVVGALNTLVTMGLFRLLLLVPGAPASGQEGFVYYTTGADGIAYIVGICNSFMWNKYWTFSAAKSHRGWREFGMFFLVNLPPLAVNVFVFALLGLWAHSGSGWVQMGKAFVAALVAVVWNFLGSRYLAFRHTAVKAKDEKEQQ
jgi:putative flippase GtrA